ncbi:MAG: winged helix-turn-helix domain-containing protein, partial [Pseudomonadota bacterium]
MDSKFRSTLHDRIGASRLFQCYRVGDWRVDPAARELTDGTRTRRLSPRAMGALLLLVEADGAVVSRADLINTIWPDVTVADESLTTAISELRRALDDRHEPQPVIQTVYGGGYRLVVSACPDDGFDKPVETTEAKSVVRHKSAELPSVTSRQAFSADVVSNPRQLHRRAVPSIVVLPFANLQPDNEDYFVDGIVEEVTAALSRTQDLFVIARQTAYTYKNHAVDARQIGEDLGVRYLLEGAVRRSGDRFRVTVQLVETETGTQLWSGRFEESRANQFDLQDEIASLVAGAVLPGIRTSEIELSRRTRPENLHAYDLVLRALPHFWAHRDDENRRAIELLDEALRMDPNYGVALAYKAWCHAQHACYLWSENPHRDRKIAAAAADQAAIRVSDHAGALTAIGAAYRMVSTDGKLAEAFIDKSLEIDPNNAWSWMRLGWLRVSYGRTEEAIDCFRNATRLSPRDPFLFNIYFGMSAALAKDGDLLAAIELLEDGLRSNPGVTWAYRTLAAYYAKLGQRERALGALNKLLASNPGLTIERLRAG